jgi:hypothetical protein
MFLALIVSEKASPLPHAKLGVVGEHHDRRDKNSENGDNG